MVGFPKSKKTWHIKRETHTAVVSRRRCPVPHSRTIFGKVLYHIHWDLSWSNGPSLVEWTSRRAPHRRWWDKHLLGRGLSKTVACFSSKKSCRWWRKVTERPLLLCERKLPNKLSFACDTVQTPSASMRLVVCDRPAALGSNACKRLRLACDKRLRRTVERDTSIDRLNGEKLACASDVQEKNL